MLNYAAPSIRRWGGAIVAGLQQADTLSLRFEEEEGEVWQWLAADRTFGKPSIIVDLRTAPDPHRAATERMQADPAAGSACRRRQPAGVPSAAARRRRPLVLVSAISPLAGGWLQLPGDNPADRRHLPRPAAGKPLLSRLSPPSPRWWTSTSAYAGSEAWQRDKAFWQAQRQALPAPASLSAAPLAGAPPGSDICADEAGDERRRLPPPGQPCAAVSAR